MAVSAKRKREQNRKRQALFRKRRMEEQGLQLLQGYYLTPDEMQKARTFLDALIAERADQ